MYLSEWMPVAADGASIIAAVSSTSIGVLLWWRARADRVRLRRYLRRMTRERQARGEEGLETLLQITRGTKLSEEQIMRAASASRMIRLRVSKDGDGYASRLLLGYGKH